MYKRDSDRFLLFVFISLVIHVLVFLVFPFGNFSVLGNKGQQVSYGFIQLVEYRVEVPQKVNTTPQKTATNTSEVEEVTPKTSQKESNEDTFKDTTPNNLSDKPQTKPEPKDIVATEPVENIETPNEAITNKPPEQEPDLVQDAAEDNNVQEIVTSESSNLEITVSENKKKVEIESQKEPTPPTSAEEGEETEGDENAEASSPPPPPPPPTAGDLIIGAPLPAYPKDLVSQTLTGIVELEVHVSSTGNVEKVEILNSSGIESMDRTAQLTLERGWKFKDYKQPYSMVIIVEYRMDENGNPEVEVSHHNLTFK